LRQVDLVISILGHRDYFADLRPARNDRVAVAVSEQTRVLPFPPPPPPRVDDRVAVAAREQTRVLPFLPSARRGKFLNCYSMVFRVVRRECKDEFLIADKDGQIVDRYC